MYTVKNQNGFSLVEVLVVTGIMSVVLFAMGQTYISFSKQLNKIEVRQDLVAFGTQLQTVIASKTLCENSLGLAAGNVTFNPTQARQTDPVNGLPVSMMILNDRVQANAQLNEYPLNVNFLTICHAAVAGTDSAGLTMYKVNLNAGMSSRRATLGGENLRPINAGSFIIKVDSGLRIRNCLSLNTLDS